MDCILDNIIVCWCQSEGFISGVPKNKFSVNNLVMAYWSVDLGLLYSAQNFVLILTIFLGRVLGLPFYGTAQLLF